MVTDTLTNRSGTAQKNIPGMDVLKAMPFPLPPLAEQRRIVAQVEQLMALVDELESQLVNARSVGTELLDGLLEELILGRALARSSFACASWITRTCAIARLHMPYQPYGLPIWRARSCLVLRSLD